MRPFWQFAKPKGPGFGISKNFYLSVLAGVPVLPAISQIISPKPVGGAVDGFGVPLIDSKDKTLLDQPMQRGVYALSTKDQKNVIRMMIMNAEEAGFSPEAIATSTLAQKVSPEVLVRIRSTWHLIQLTWESHDPDVYPALDFFLSLAERLAHMTEGIVADPISGRYLMPDQVFVHPRAEPRVDAREHVFIQSRADGSKTHAFTKGMAKFNLPELELYGLENQDVDFAAQMLMAASQGALLGFLIQNGSDVAGFEAREGGHNKGLWEGIPVLELLPPTRRSVGDVLRSWKS